MRQIARASTTGHGTNIIIGVAKGLESSFLPALTISGGEHIPLQDSFVFTCSIGILLSYFVGSRALPGGGLYGTAVATMGMLSTAVYVLVS